jgi:hypothetical protein
LLEALERGLDELDLGAVGREVGGTKGGLGEFEVGVGERDQIGDVVGQPGRARDRGG